jgi:hypothetical protein
LLVASAFALLAAFAPRANAALIRFYDFEGTPTAPYPVNLESHTPAVETGPGTTLVLRDENGNPFPAANTLVGPPINLNLPAGAAPNLVSLGVNHTHEHNLNVDIPFPSSQGIYDVTSVSFAYASNGNGYSAFQLQMSTNGGVTFNINLSGVIALASTPGQVITVAIPSGTTLNINNLVLRLAFTGGASNGTNLQFQLDNVQIGGTIVPEPATVAAGLLGVLGLCWFQRRRLIRSLGFRKA